MKKVIFLLAFLFQFYQTNANDFYSKDYINEIKKYNLVEVLNCKKFDAMQGDTEIFYRLDPIGFIGSNFQRFRIHFISMIQNPTNKLQYLVYGKTKVKNNICSFQGVITINKTRIAMNDDEYPKLKRGLIEGEYEFYEDSRMKGAGMFKGSLESSFFIDSNSIIHYDALELVADGYDNNQYKGKWRSYKSGETKTCNWGDYRIPESEDLDTGAGYFFVHNDYLKNGWEDYMLCNGYENDEKIIEAAEKRENEKWWLGDE